MSFSIKLRTDQFEQLNLVVGRIWLEIDGDWFPESGWDDFPVVILGWWLKAVKPLIANQAAKCECLFMDGPYKFEITAREPTSWIVTCIKDGMDGEETLLETKTDPKILVDEMLSAARVVVDLCHQRGWESTDLSTLEREVDSVQNMI